MTIYRVHGLNIASELDLPELVATARPGARPDARIVLDNVAAEMDGGQTTEDGFVMAGESILIDVDGIARFLVEDGQRITIGRAPDAAPDAVRAFLYGAAFSVLLQQLALMPLHASAVVVDGEAIAFLGASGHGKSTLAAAFAKRGHPALADDKMVVRMSGGRLSVAPSPPLLTLDPAAAVAHGHGAERRVSSARRFGKHSYLLPEYYTDKTAPLAAIHVLDWSPVDASPKLTRLSPFESLLELRSNMNAGLLVEPLGQETDFIAWAEDIIAAVPVYRLTRPRNLGAIDAVVDAVIAERRAR